MKNTKNAINDATVKSYYEILDRYKAGKASLEGRIIENEEWWRMRSQKSTRGDNSSTGWLFNSIINKHADAMDNLPTVSFLPREAGDTAASHLLSDIVPVILEENKFESTYSACWYDKLKSGTACYGVFWDPTLDGGIGNVDIRRIDLLNLFWEPGISDIQKSKMVFHVELQDNSSLAKKYPSLKDHLSAPDFTVSRYFSDEASPTEDKSCVIDCYYKKAEGKREVVHFCKFCNGILLYSSENDERYANRGFYDHGKYPFILDTLYPVQGSPCGFGVIDAMKNTQGQIDALSSAIVKNARMAAERRYFVRSDGALNEKEFADFTRPFVHYHGSGDPSASIMPITSPLLSDVYVSVLREKIDELKETSGNRDFSQGTASGGVTAAAAIAALQEAGSKTSRDMISSTYRAFEEVCALIVCLIGQFYTVPRCFRITGVGGMHSFVYCSRDELSPLSARFPVYDIKIRAHKRSAYSQAAANELAMQLYKMGLFSPDNIAQASLCLSIMDFEGKDEIISKLSETDRS